VPANIKKSLVIECIAHADEALERAIVLKEGESLFKELPLPAVYAGEAVVTVDNSPH
jgi:ATP-dependent Lon protease